ncbi:uncharacterized protein G2W53_008383 [Senna tora]|uniref:Uncharacterized protein n=1 Tax=Senna tora TaxID=362788 RepID=A0A834X7R7_9FABA|nr:uncharacterized protein G2W53_008383 [Senna tora]
MLDRCYCQNLATSGGSRIGKLLGLNRMKVEAEMAARRLGRRVKMKGNW